MRTWVSGLGALGFLGEAEDSLADDVALDLAGAAPDGLAATEEERAHHRADRVAGAALLAGEVPAPVSTKNYPVCAWSSPTRTPA